MRALSDHKDKRLILFSHPAEALILTNAPVAAHADNVRVRLSDRREFPAKMLVQRGGTKRYVALRLE